MRRQRGFTLIELLVVIGIILVLLGIVVLGYRHLHSAGARRETIVELKACVSLLQEYENHKRLDGIEGTNPGNANPSPNVYTDPIIRNNPNARAYIQLTDLQANSSGDVTDSKNANGARFGSNAVMNTLNVMQAILREPKNRSIVAAMPPKRILAPPPPPPPAAWQNYSIANAVILDGWDDPIIFVPAGGLIVSIPDPANSANVIYYVVRSTGTIQIGPSQPATASPPTTAPPPASANDRPFFASAGEDGDFTKGADNVYSFNAE